MKRASPPCRRAFQDSIEVIGDAMATPAGAGRETHEAEGLGRGGVDHLPHVDADALVEGLELALTSAMLTPRKTFFVSFDASATRDDETRTTRVTAEPYSDSARSPERLSMPPTSLGMFRVVCSRSPGFSRSGG